MQGGTGEETTTSHGRPSNPVQQASNQQQSGIHNRQQWTPSQHQRGLNQQQSIFQPAPDLEPSTIERQIIQGREQWMRSQEQWVQNRQQWAPYQLQDRETSDDYSNVADTLRGPIGDRSREWTE